MEWQEISSNASKRPWYHFSIFPISASYGLDLLENESPFHFSKKCDKNQQNSCALKLLIVEYKRCICSSVDRAMASGAVCVGSIPIRCTIFLPENKSLKP